MDQNYERRNPGSMQKRDMGSRPPFSTQESDRLQVDILGKT